jgi:Ser/Thr protein kinase RdoA (MazF antagonist)
MGGAMTMLHVKHYPDLAARRAAQANYQWLAGLGTPIRLPGLITASGLDLYFEHIDGRRARPEDLAMLAAHLGHVHGVAHAKELCQARLRRPYRTPCGHTLASFPGRRTAAVARELRAGNVPSAALTIVQARRLLTRTDGPAAFYKDANPRNFLITPAGTVVTIDFDDLTLAPFGYDLAKLVVTLAMTSGPLPRSTIEAARRAYNNATAGHSATLPAVSLAQMMNWAEIHHILTSRYASDGRYPYRWHEVRPMGDPAWP